MLFTGGACKRQLWLGTAADKPRAFQYLCHSELSKTLWESHFPSASIVFHLNWYLLYWYPPCTPPQRKQTWGSPPQLHALASTPSLDMLLFNTFMFYLNVQTFPGLNFTLESYLQSCLLFSTLMPLLQNHFSCHIWGWHRAVYRSHYVGYVPLQQELNDLTNTGLILCLHISFIIFICSQIICLEFSKSSKNNITIFHSNCN